MLIVVKVKPIDNIIGLKEDIASRLEDVVDIERIDVCDDECITIPKLNLNWNKRKDGENGKLQTDTSPKGA